MVVGKTLEKVFQTKFVVSGSVGAACLYFQNGLMARWMIGALFNSLLSKVLKRLFNEPRPEQSRLEGKLDPGFPSSHAHMLFYLAGFIAIAMPQITAGFEMWVSVLYIVALIGSAWRVRIGRHTVSQVVAGCISGSLGAGLFHWLWSRPAIIWFDHLVEEIIAEHKYFALGTFVVGGAVIFAFLLVFSDKITIRGENKGE